jgi:hypothetical protein
VQGDEMGKLKDCEVQFKDYSLTPWQLFWLKVRWRFWYRKFKMHKVNPILDIEWPPAPPMLEQDDQCGTCGARLEE